MSKSILNLGDHGLSTWIAIAILVSFAAVVWLPAVATPFWGDDYSFLLEAHAANLEGVPWWSSFWPEASSGFWRPLSEDSWWRFVDGALDADPQRAHWANLILLGVAAGCVSLLGLSIARACEWLQPVGTAILAGAIYGVLALHFLPVHWAAAANSSVLVVFTALILAAWIAAPHAGPLIRALLLTAVPALLALALLSKESAAMIPLLMIVLSNLVGRNRYRRGDAIVWLVCAGMVVAWLLIRAQITAGSDANYELVFGANLLRNGLSLSAWQLNVPREALRLAVTGHPVPGIVWSAAVALPTLAAWTIAVRHGLRQYDRRHALLVLAFWLLAYAPYFPLAWNSYAYYAAIAAMLPAVVLARGLAGHRHAVTAAVLIGLSSWLAVVVSRELDHPGLIGRAHWAEATLAQLEKEQITEGLSVHSHDPQRFHAIGTAGLRWRLGLPPGSIHIVPRCSAGANACLTIEADGRHTLEPVRKGGSESL